MSQSLEFVLESAMGVAAGRYAPMYKRVEYEDAMLEVAKREARLGESTAVAFARLCEEGDQRVVSLYTAARQADAEETFEKREASEKLRAERNAKLDEQMHQLALERRQEDETPEAAFARLMKDDPNMRALYDEHQA